jgi:pyrroline-5-carboxylate reductase
VAGLGQKIGFIGAGNMGEAFTGALIKSGTFKPAEIFLSDISKSRLDQLKASYGINITKDSFELFSQCHIIVLAVKPQIMAQVLSQLADQAKEHLAQKRKLIISIAAGIKMEKIEDLLYGQINQKERQNLPVIRVMPNTPALVLSGMSGMCSNIYATEKDLITTKTILETMGNVIEFDEDKMDAVTALSGSGPAYVFYLAESMMEAGISIGLDPKDASVLTMTTLKGALKLMEEKDESPETLRKKVTSPGGTTEAAFNVFENNQVKDIIIEAITAAKKRSKELSR